MMKNIVNKQSPSVTQQYFDKGIGDRAKRLLFVYRLGTDRTKYLERVLEGVKIVLDTGRFVHVFLVFVKGIPKPYAEEVVQDATEGMADIEKFFEGVFIRVSPFIDITMETVRKLEARNG